VPYLSASEMTIALIMKPYAGVLFISLLLVPLLVFNLHFTGLLFPELFQLVIEHHVTK